MKSICILAQSLYEYDPRVKRKAEALVAAGYAVDVFTLRTTPTRKRFVLNGVNVYTVALGKKRGSLARYVFEYAAFFVWAFVRSALLAFRKRYVAVDVNTLPDFLIFAPVIAKYLGAKLVLDMHEITPEFYMSKYGIAESSRLIRLLKYLERISFSFADHVITINEPIQDLLVTRGLPRAKSTIVMNAADEARFTASSGTAGPAPAADAPTFAMMYHGTLNRIYGLDIAIEAFALAEKDMPGAEIWMMGIGQEDAALRTLARQRGVASKIKVMGPVPSTEVPSWLRRCDVGLLPMRRDALLDFAFPNKLSEFIVTGRPVLVSRLKTMRHYFSEEALAYFEPHDAVDLAQQMVRLYRDRDLRAQLAAKAREEYAPMAWDIMKQRYLDLIDGLANPTQRTAGSFDVEPVVGSR
jgi:glycosyltransferase involved in cell wall biosynthesis